VTRAIVRVDLNWGTGDRALRIGKVDCGGTDWRPAWTDQVRPRTGPGSSAHQPGVEAHPSGGRPS